MQGQLHFTRRGRNVGRLSTGTRCDFEPVHFLFLISKPLRDYGRSYHTLADNRGILAVPQKRKELPP